MDKSVDNNINQLHPSKILEEMGIAWNDTVEKKTSQLYKKVSSVIPDIEWPYFAPYIEAINILKKEKNATILAHNYQTPEIFHCVSDVRGDSLQLAKEATKVDSDIIIQCGVYFMAETSKILNMDKKIIIPSLDAGCSLAASIKGQDVIDLKRENPGIPVVTYVNSSADVKAETDICCTSSNALEVVNSLDSDKVIFIPDEYLAMNIAKETKKEIIMWLSLIHISEPTRRS